MEQVQFNTGLGKLLDWCQDQGASDLHAQAGQPYCFRVHGKLSRIPDDISPAPSQDALFHLLRETFSAAICSRIERELEVDLSFYYGNHRYRANFSKQKGEQSFSLRTVPQQRLKLKDLQLPSSLTDVVTEPRGLVLATGPTGQGKSTTMRALIQDINETRPMRIITIEDPIEYVFEPVLSQF